MFIKSIEEYLDKRDDIYLSDIVFDSSFDTTNVNIYLL